MKRNNTDPYPLAPQILYEDNHLMIINKRPSEIVQGDKSGDVTLLDTVKAYLRVKYSKPGEVFLGLVHRIDRPVSGAVILAKTSKALTRLNQMLQDREIRKVYWAVVAKTAAQDLPHSTDENGWQHLVHFLKRNEKQNKSYAFDIGGPGRVRAEMKFRKIAESDRYDLMEVELITGRHHQIRAQFAAIGIPIRGDLKYGYPRSNPGGSIHLHARQVEFIHPVKKEKISILAPAPPDKLWDHFSSITGKKVT